MAGTDRILIILKITYFKGLKGLQSVEEFLPGVDPKLTQLAPCSFSHHNVMTANIYCLLT